MNIPKLYTVLAFLPADELLEVVVFHISANSTDDAIKVFAGSGFNVHERAFIANTDELIEHYGADSAISDNARMAQVASAEDEFMTRKEFESWVAVSTTYTGDCDHPHPVTYIEIK